MRISLYFAGKKLKIEAAVYSTMLKYRHTRRIKCPVQQKAKRLSLEGDRYTLFGDTLDSVHLMPASEERLQQCCVCSTKQHNSLIQPPETTPRAAISLMHKGREKQCNGC